MSMMDHLCGFELCFHSIHNAGHVYAFACDATGCVDLDAMGERDRTRYFYARTCIGREFFTPTVRRCAA
jgi:hypothetical protein